MPSIWSNIGYNLSGKDRLEIAELQEKVAELSDKFDGLSERFTELSGKFDGLSTDLSDKFNGLQEKFTGLQENFTGLEEKVETPTEAVADQEKIMATCIIISAVAAIVITSFVAFCIYQGVKREREKEKNPLDQDTPKAELDYVDTNDGNEKQHIRTPD